MSDDGNCSCFVFILFCFVFLKYSPPDPSVLLLSESDGEQFYPGNKLFFFLFLHKWLIVCKNADIWQVVCE